MSTTPNHMMLRIDLRALAALFPEGSPARVELQQAVVAEFVRKHLKDSVLGSGIEAMLTETRDNLRAEIRAARDQLLKNDQAVAGVTGDYWRGIRFSDDAKNAIKSEAYAVLKGVIEESIKGHVATHMQRLEKAIANAVQAATTKAIEDQVSAAVRARVAAVVEKLGAA